MERIVILGHRSPDIDSIISGCLLEKLMNSKGYNAKFIIEDEGLEKNTNRIVKKYNIDINNHKDKIQPTDVLFLVDTHTTSHKNQIIGIIDHHPAPKDQKYSYYKNKKSASTALLIYKLGKDVFDNNDAKLAVLASLDDTICFNNKKAAMFDKKFIMKLCLKENLDYIELYKDSLVINDLKTLKNNFDYGMKEFIFNGYKINSTYIQITDISNDQIFEFINHYSDIMKEDDNISLWLFVIHNLHTKKSIAFEIYPNKVHRIDFEYLISRGTKLIPQIEKEFNQKKRGNYEERI